MAIRACAKHEENLDGIELESPRAFPSPEAETLPAGRPASNQSSIVSGNFATDALDGWLATASCDLRGVRRGRMVKLSGIVYMSVWIKWSRSYG
jgi:hypothetical protein